MTDAEEGMERAEQSPPRFKTMKVVYGGEEREITLVRCELCGNYGFMSTSTEGGCTACANLKRFGSVA